MFRVGKSADRDRNLIFDTRNSMNCQLSRFVLAAGEVVFTCLGVLGYINPLLLGRSAQFASPN